MAYLFPRNTTGFSTIETLLVNNLQIQTQSTGGFSIFTQDPEDPLFTVDGTTGTITTRGTLNVLGSAEFKETNIAKTTQSLFEMADANDSSDAVDIGVFGQYNAGSGVVYSSIYRNSADPARRWFFVNDFTATPPLDTVPGITSANFAGVVGKNFNANPGTVSLPAFTFYADNNTGMYNIGADSIGFAAGGLLGASITNNSGTINVVLSTSSILHYASQATINDIASSVGGGVTTGSLTLQATGLADKWARYMSTNPVGAYSGTAYSFGTSSHYFATNANSIYTISFTTENLAGLLPPDYRHVSKSNLLLLNTTYLLTTVPHYGPAATAAAPAYTFTAQPSTGMFQNTANSVSFSAQSTLVLDLFASYIYPAQPIRAPNGTLAAPSYSFFTTAGTGFFRDTAPALENITIALGGVNSGHFILNAGNIPQLQMGMGTATYPSFAFNSTGAGIYSPQIDGATQGIIGVASNTDTVWLFKNRTGTAQQGAGNHQCINAIDFIPDNSNTIARINTDSSKFLTLKSQTASIQGYELIDSKVLLLYRFDDFAALGKDSSEAAVKKNALVVGAPPGQYLESDGTIAKKYTLDLTSNSDWSPKYLSLTAHIASFATVNAFTLSLWFKCASAPVGNSSIISFLNTTTGNNICVDVLNGSNAIRVTVESTAITKLEFNTNGVSVKDNKWHHLVLQLGPNGNRLYIDGTKLTYAGTLAYTSGGNGVPTADYATNTLKDLIFHTIIIGGKFDGVTFSKPYVGYLYSIYMTAAELSASQIAALYAEGSLSVYSIDVTNLNVANQTSTGQTIVGDGTAALPSFSFINEPNSGLYRIGTGNLGISILGALVFDFNATRLQNSGVYYSASGSAASPAYTFTSDTDTGISNTAANTLVLSTNGTSRIAVNTTGITTSLSLYAINGTVGVPAYSFAADPTTGLYEIGVGNLGIAINGANVIDINSTRLLNSGLYYSAAGTNSSPAYSFAADTNTGLYNSAADTLVVTTGGADRLSINTTGIIAAIQYLGIAGTSSVPSYSFTADTNTGLYNSAADTVAITTGGSDRLTISTTGVTATVQYLGIAGTVSVPTYSFAADTNTGLYNSAADTLAFTTNGVNRLSISTSAISAALTVQLPDGSVTAPSIYFASSLNSGIYYDGSNRVAIAAAGVSVGSFGTDAIRLNYPIRAAADTESSPFYTYDAQTSTGIWYTSNTLNVSTQGVKRLAISASGMIIYNSSLITGNSTAVVSVNSSKLSATATQTLLNSAPVLEYTFSNIATLAADNSINKYTGGINGVVTASTPVADNAGNGPLNPYSITLGSGAGNGIYTNVSSMSEMTNMTTFNVTILIKFNSLIAGTLPANCWAIYGNYTTPTQNYIRLYVTAGGILNIVCVSGGSVSIEATYSSVVASSWYRIEFITVSGGHQMFLNGTNVTASLQYSSGSSATTFPFSSSMTDSTAMRTYVGGGINAYTSPSCEIAYFAIIQTGASDTVTPYRQQVHELVTNKLTISGFPYNTNSSDLNEGMIAVSSKSGQLKWDNSIVVSSTAVTIPATKDLVASSFKMVGMMKYNYQISSAGSIDLTADRIGHYYTFTASNVGITLPTGSTQAGREFVFTWKGTLPGSITITCSGSDTIGGSVTTITYSQKTNTTFKIVYDGVGDWIFT
jgi:hypothetical protein